ncbi:unnamed protein product [Lepeophtheirus salmonis]|uniref:(salmon louse) hypothetical protein n=1 Tax=Lepeophtheirus salmonis TaxID=72036 RepID=A0A7R8CRP0_LEPSM|nr:unnamed protein product [Lepeophtheirus salmonis]CAF2907411.1 unnamed protein product [Lepeophtheirus salmonis]
MTFDRRILSLSFLVLSLGSTMVEPHHQGNRRRSIHHLEDTNDGCFKRGGRPVLNAWLSSQEELVYCIMQNFDFEEIQKELFLSKSGKGVNSDMFQSYCGQPMARSLPCVKNFLEASSQCLEEEEQNSLNVTMSMIESAVKFICHKRARRISLFLLSNGMECLKDHASAISTCVNTSIPEILHMNNQKRFDLIVFNHRNCQKIDQIRHCIEKEMFKCPNPEPLRLLENFMSTIRKKTHCHRVSKYSLLSGSERTNSPSSPLIFLFFLLHYFLGLFF